MKLKKLVKKAKADVKKIMPGIKLPEIYIQSRKANAYLYINKDVAGFYNNSSGEIILCKNILKELDKEEAAKVVYHEIGHFVHDHYLNYKAQYLPRKHKGSKAYYCNKNQKESFATCFSDYVNKISNNKPAKSDRLKKMEKIIVSINNA